jgi:NADPH2:quinone reductase
MRAVVLASFGGPEVLEVREVPDPSPAVGEIVVRIRGTALNRADILQREGRYPAPPGAPPDIPGMEYAGEVERLGPEVTGWSVGQRVFGIAGGGTYAERLAVPADTAIEIPDGLDWIRAAAVPEAFITAHDAMLTQAGLLAGERVLIHAVGSGVGLAAVQVARAAGAVPYGTSRTADKLDVARRWGMEDGIALSGDPDAMLPHVAEWTRGQGVEVVLDLVGGAYTASSLRALGRRGRLMLVGLVAGSEARLDLRRLLSWRITLRGTVLRSRTHEEKVSASGAFARDIVPHLASGRVQPVVDSVFPLDRIADAHRRLESNDTVGKIVITV